MYCCLLILYLFSKTYEMFIDDILLVSYDIFSHFTIKNMFYFSFFISLNKCLVVGAKSINSVYMYLAKN